MSWLFSQALVEEYSPDKCSDGEPCAPLNVMPTQRQFWRNDKTMDVLRRSPFGLTYRLKAIGNGQVPQCAAEAFRQLYWRLND